MVGSRIPSVSQQQLVQIFGADAAREILSIDDQQWQGPIDSIQGTHFVRVVDRSQPSIPTFEELAPYLEGEWVAAQQRETVTRELAAVKHKYKVIIEEMPGEPGD